MEMTFKISTAEFSLSVFEKIQDFIRRSEMGEVTIRVRPKKKKAKTAMTQEDFFKKIDKALDDIDNNKNVVTFTPEAFDQFIQTK